jgi:thioredoxin reductase
MFSEGRELLMEKLRRKEVHIITNATVKEITPDSAVVEIAGCAEKITGMDYIIIATGSEPVNELAAAAPGGTEIYIIGDASEPRQVLDAIREGWEIGRIL